MGFLSKLMKNPVMQMLAPMALSMAFPAMGGMFASKFPAMSGIFSNMNPMASNALKQSLLGYGTGLVTGAEDPGKQAMYSGLASLPFSYMSAANQAKNFNKTYGTLPGKSPIYGTGPSGMENINVAGMPPMQRHIPGARSLTGYSNVDPLKKISAWDILSEPGGYKFDAPRYEMWDQEKIRIPSEYAGEKTYMDLPQLSPGGPETLGADIFTKNIPGEATLGEYGLLTTDPQIKPDWIPTMASQSAGALGEYLESADIRAAKEWDRKKKRRKKELAWMYGVPEDLIQGEMDNPWYQPGGFWNKGGIASLENGGGVNGPGTGTSDSIDAKLSDGEFVMTANAVENLGGGDRYEGARKMYDMMNMLDPESETIQEVV
jgi:hypothetical protein